MIFWVNCLPQNKTVSQMEGHVQQYQIFNTYHNCLWYPAILIYSSTMDLRKYPCIIFTRKENDCSKEYGINYIQYDIELTSTPLEYTVKIIILKSLCTHQYLHSVTLFSHITFKKHTQSQSLLIYAVLPHMPRCSWHIYPHKPEKVHKTLP